MFRFLTLAFILLVFTAITHAQQTDEFTTYQRVEINITENYDPFVMHLLGIEIDHAHKTQKAIIAELSLFDIRRLQENNFQVNVLIEDVSEYYAQRAADDDTPVLQMLEDAPENFEQGSMGGFLTYEEIIEQFEKMHDLYPDLISTRQDIGESIESRSIWKVVAGSPQSAGKPQALYTSLIHAREAASVTTLIYYLWWLLENYGLDDEATYLLDNREMFFVPVVNPDGYVHNERTNPDGGGMFRGNRRFNPSNNTYGVDLNRNFGPTHAWDSPYGGSSTVPGSGTYRGTAPFSEPETQALRDLAERNDFKTAFNYHTFSNLLIYPFGFNQSRTPDSLLYDMYGKNMTAENNYFVGLDQ